LAVSIAEDYRLVTSAVAR